MAVSLLSRGSGRLGTLLDTPPSNTPSSPTRFRLSSYRLPNVGSAWSFSTPARQLGRSSSNAGRCIGADHRSQSRTAVAMRAWLVHSFHWAVPASTVELVGPPSFLSKAIPILSRPVLGRIVACVETLEAPGILTSFRAAGRWPTPLNGCNSCERYVDGKGSSIPYWLGTWPCGMCAVPNRTSSSDNCPAKFLSRAATSLL